MWLERHWGRWTGAWIDAILLMPNLYFAAQGYTLNAAASGFIFCMFLMCLAMGMERV
jgi:hypothetical protein